eukprot:scaffold32214_cov61-Phaeocystis_antarctica.AAC.7
MHPPRAVRHVPAAHLRGVQRGPVGLPQRRARQGLPGAPLPDVREDLLPRLQPLRPQEGLEERPPDRGAGRRPHSGRAGVLRRPVRQVPGRRLPQLAHVE